MQDGGDSADHDDDEPRGLPFTVEVERVPPSTIFASALVVAASALVAARVAPMIVVVPLLVVSALGRRLATKATRVVVTASGLELGSRALRADDLLDVWVDADDVQPIAAVALATDAELLVLHFENRAQAARFDAALPDACRQKPARVAGARLRQLDLLPPARFLALAAAFAATGSPYGLLLFGVFALAAWPVLRARQLIATERGLEVRTLLGARTHAYDEIASVDVDAGVVTRRDGAEIDAPRSTLRDGTRAPAPWLERARSRVLAAVRERARSASAK